MTPPEGGPEETARAFVEALNAGRWREAAALVHPALAERHRAMELSLVLSYAENIENGMRVGANEAFTLRGDDRLDEAKLRRYAGSLVPGYRGAATVEDVAAIPADELAALALENAMAHGYAGTLRIGMRLELDGVEVRGDSARAAFRARPVRAPAAWGSPADLERAGSMEMLREGGRWLVSPRSLLERGYGIDVIFHWIVEEAIAAGEQNRASGF